MFRIVGSLACLLVVGLQLASCGGDRNSGSITNAESSPCVIDFPAGPLVIVTGTNPWEVVPGSGNPSFVLYADGTVIYSQLTNGESVLLTAILKPCELRDLLDRLTPAQLKALNGRRFSAGLATDLGLVSLILRDPDGSFSSTEVYGWSSDWQTKQQSASQPGPPPELDYALRVLHDFSWPDATKFEPLAFRVYLSPSCSGAQAAPKPWPASWPDSSAATLIGFGPWRAMNLSTVTSREIQETLGSSDLFHWRCIAVRNRRDAVMYRPVLPYEAVWSREIGLSERSDDLPATAPN
jgi:hypothetical protein